MFEGWRDGSMGKSAFCTSMRTRVWVPRTHKKIWCGGAHLRLWQWGSKGMEVDDMSTLASQSSQNSKLQSQWEILSQKPR